MSLGRTFLIRGLIVLVMCGNDFSTVMKESKNQEKKKLSSGGKASILSRIYLVDTMAKQVDYEFLECAAGPWHMAGRGQGMEPHCIPRHRSRVTGCSPPPTTEIKGEGSVNLKVGQSSQGRGDKIVTTGFLTLSCRARMSSTCVSRSNVDEGAIPEGLV